VDTEIVRFAEPEILTVRDMLGAAPTTSDSVKYVQHTATTRAAASQATRGALKNYLKVTFSAATASVETIAVLSKVTEQDIDDAPRLVAYINGEQRLDVKVEEDRQLLHGTGADGEILGLYAAGITEFDRAAVGDTIIDTIRRMRTDLRRIRVLPNFVAIDPLDWEEVELAKGTDERYVWGMITDIRGPRIWSLRVVETDAMTHPTTGERRLLVADGIRGATVYDRHDVRLAVGYVDDDFARNLRTLRAEERLALAVKRAYAFKYAVTAAAES
jgi:HK97 family phage major capsid protein